MAAAQSYPGAARERSPRPPARLSWSSSVEETSSGSMRRSSNDSAVGSRPSWSSTSSRGLSTLGASSRVLLLAQSLSLCRDDVTRVARRLDTGLEDGEAERRAAREQQRAADGGGEPAPPAAPGEQGRAGGRARLGEAAVPSGFALAVHLAYEAEPSLHQLRQPELGDRADERRPPRRPRRVRRGDEDRGCAAA